MLIAGVLVFSSNASANEKNFDVLSGVTAETMSPSAMDAIRGMGSIEVGFFKVSHPYLVPNAHTGDLLNNGPWDIRVHLEIVGARKNVRTLSE